MGVGSSAKGAVSWAGNKAAAFVDIGVRVNDFVEQYKQQLTRASKYTESWTMKWGKQYGNHIKDIGNALLTSWQTPVQSIGSIFLKKWTMIGQQSDKIYSGIKTTTQGLLEMRKAWTDIGRIQKEIAAANKMSGGKGHDKQLDADLIAAKNAYRGARVVRNQGALGTATAALGLAAPIAIGSAGLAAAGTVAGAKLAYSGLQKYSDLEYKMATIKGITGTKDTDTQAITNLDALKETIKNLGETTSWTQDEIASGAEMLARGGIAVKDITNMLKPLSDVARSTGSSMQTVASTFITVLTTFRKSSYNTKKIGDMMVKTVNISSQSFDNLSQAMTYMASTAQASGRKIEDVLVESAALANVGIRGSMQGTVLNNISTRAASNTKAKAELEKLGVNPFEDDGEGRMKNIVQLAQEIRAAQRELGYSQRDILRSFHDMWGLYGQKGLGIANQDYNYLYNSIVKGSDGAADYQARQMEQTLKGQTLIMKSQLDAAMSQGGNILAPFVEKVMKFWTDNIGPKLEKKIIEVFEKLGNAASGQMNAEDVARTLGALANAAIDLTERFLVCSKAVLEFGQWIAMIVSTNGKYLLTSKSGEFRNRYFKLHAAGDETSSQKYQFDAALTSWGNKEAAYLENVKRFGDEGYEKAKKEYDDLMNPEFHSPEKDKMSEEELKAAQALALKNKQATLKGAQELYDSGVASGNTIDQTQAIENLNAAASGIIEPIKEQEESVKKMVNSYLTALKSLQEASDDFTKHTGATYDWVRQDPATGSFNHKESDVWNHVIKEWEFVGGDRQAMDEAYENVEQMRRELVDNLHMAIPETKDAVQIFGHDSINDEKNNNLIRDRWLNQSSTAWQTVTKHPEMELDLLHNEVDDTGNVIWNGNSANDFFKGDGWKLSKWNDLAKRVEDTDLQIKKEADAADLEEEAEVWKRAWREEQNRNSKPLDQRIEVGAGSEPVTPTMLAQLGGIGNVKILGRSPEQYWSSLISPDEMSDEMLALYTENMAAAEKGDLGSKSGWKQKRDAAQAAALRRQNSFYSKRVSGLKEKYNDPNASAEEKEAAAYSIGIGQQLMQENAEKIASLTPSGMSEEERRKAAEEKLRKQQERDAEKKRKEEEKARQKAEAEAKKKQEADAKAWAKQKEEEERAWAKKQEEDAKAWQKEQDAKKKAEMKAQAEKEKREHDAAVEAERKAREEAKAKEAAEKDEAKRLKEQLKYYETMSTSEAAQREYIQRHAPAPGSVKEVGRVNEETGKVEYDINQITPDNVESITIGGVGVRDLLKAQEAEAGHILGPREMVNALRDQNDLRNGTYDLTKEERAQRDNEAILADSLARLDEINAIIDSLTKRLLENDYQSDEEKQRLQAELEGNKAFSNDVTARIINITEQQTEATQEVAKQQERTLGVTASFSALQIERGMSTKNTVVSINENVVKLYEIVKKILKKPTTHIDTFNI